MQAMAGVKSSFTIYALSEQAVTVSFGNTINEDIWQQVSHFNNLIHQNPFPGFVTTVPAYTSVTVFYKPVQVMLVDAMPGADSFARVSNYLKSLKDYASKKAAIEGEIVTIPVYYGGEFGPDLEEVAAANNLTAAEVIVKHSAAIYKVYMIGFVPGFAYLGGMPEELAMPRKATPRAVIPAGSVGIAGKQTGVYPLETPGGWQIIGRTPLKLFDTGRSSPALLKAGDQVVFKPIDVVEYERLIAAR
ncbi:MAG: 5-oxoprolinase subunit PxpB [Mucilaginibacter sp.]